jgi:hypothetical protein
LVFVFVFVFEVAEVVVDVLEVVLVVVCNLFISERMQSLGFTDSPA